MDEIQYDSYTTLAYLYDTTDLTMPSSKAQRIGAIAESRFITECLERDFEPHTPTTPMPWDYIVTCPAGDLKVQVKSTSVRNGTAYTCNTNSGCTMKSHISHKVDVVAIYIIPLEEWWMIPREVVTGMNIKLFHSTPPSSSMIHCFTCLSMIGSRDLARFAL